MSEFLHHNPAGLTPRRVFLAVPSYGPISAFTTLSLFRAHTALVEAGYGVELGLLAGECHVDDARNRLVREFLNGTCTDLVFIDADIGFIPDDLLRLLSHDRDVVGGTYPMKQAIEQFPVRLKGGEIWSDKDGLIEVDGLPTGFLRVRRNVLERLAADSLEYQIKGGEDTQTTRLIFERLIIDGGRVSGDYAFCHKWKQAGGRIWCDPEADLGHVGDKTWTGTLSAHLKNRAGLSLVDGITRLRDGTERDRDYWNLVREWGNDPWSAGPELLKAGVMVARQAKGPILETGCGLTTLVMAAVTGQHVHALEHKDEWASKVEQAARRLGLSNLTIHRAPLKHTPAGRWYDPPRLPWADFDVVLCDGPPRFEANRRILMGVMASHDCRPRCILVDDAETEGDAVPPDYRTEIKGQLRKFAVGLRN